LTGEGEGGVIYGIFSHLQGDIEGFALARLGEITPNPLYKGGKIICGQAQNYFHKLSPETSLLKGEGGNWISRRRLIRFQEESLQEKALSKGFRGSRPVKILDEVLGTFLEFLLSLMVVIVIVQVLARYVIEVSIPWTEEAARYMLASMTFIGGAVALKEGKHIVVDFLFQRLPPQSQRFLSLVFGVLIFIFLLMIGWGGLRLIESAWEVPTASMPWLTMGQIYLILPVGLLLMIWYTIGLFWANWKKRGMDQ
jgi:TRAP-type transport system small permease protein